MTCIDKMNYCLTLQNLNELHMSHKKEVAPKSENEKEAQLKVHQRLPLFQKQNFIWMGIGGLLVAIGMLLMTGGKNTDPNTFDTDVVYSTMRVTVAPILIIAGLLVEVYAIFKRPVNQA
jgi:hypothetical protein